MAYYPSQPSGTAKMNPYPPPGYAPQAYPGAHPGPYPPAYAPGAPAAAYPGASYPAHAPTTASPYADPEKGGFPPTEDFAAASSSALERVEKSVRMGFVRKVYGILMAQLALTFGIVCIFNFSSTAMQWVLDNPRVVPVAWVLSIAFLITIACCPGVSRKYPTNYLCLFAFTALEGFLLGVITARYETDVVLIALGITVLVVVSLTAFAFQTKYDFTNLSGMLFVSLVVLVLFGIFAGIFHSRVLSVLYACIGVIIFSVYLVYDTQLVIGGKHKYQFSVDDYVFAALNIYLDIVNLFLFVLALVSGGNRRNQG